MHVKSNELNNHNSGLNTDNRYIKKSKDDKMKKVKKEIYENNITKNIDNKMEKYENTVVADIINDNEAFLRNCITSQDNSIDHCNNNDNEQENKNINIVDNSSNLENTYVDDYNTVVSNDATNTTLDDTNLYYNTNDKVEQNWIEIGEASLFWNSLKTNIKNVFLLNEEKNIETKRENQINIENVTEHIEKQMIVKKNVIRNQKKSDIITQRKRPDNNFPISVDSFIRCLHFLTADKILECELLNKLTSDVINKKTSIFKHVKNLKLEEKWAKLPIYKRQYYLSQMKKLKHIKVSDKLYLGNGMYIHEVAGVIFQNVANLKSLELLSPEIYTDDNTPRHEPFAFAARSFEKLEKLTIIGCQTLEWLHIFRNCSFPVLKKFEVCYYPMSYDHWYWEFIFDFTILGIEGLYKILYTMENLQKISIGFDVLFDNPDAEIYNPIESRRDLLEPYSIVNINNNEIYNSTSVPPANGYPSRKFRSYRGKLCEEDYSDLFSIAYFMSEKYGKLKRIMIKYRNSHEFVEDENEGDEKMNDFLSDAANTASVCYNYVVNWFRSPTDI